MDKSLSQIKTGIYDNIDLEISDFNTEPESKAYYACRFKLNEKNIISRNAKITPTKAGQFVTFWKRNDSGIIEPLSEADLFGFFVVNIRKEERFGQFVFPKSVLIQKGIISTQNREGKRAFRVYAPWDVVSNKQAEQTQKWQLNYFYEINGSTDFKKVSELYN